MIDTRRILIAQAATGVELAENALRGEPTEYLADRMLILEADYRDTLATNGDLAGCSR